MRVVRIAAGSKFGAKKIDYRMVQSSLPGREEWVDLLRLPGVERGILAKSANWQVMMTEHIESAAPLPQRSMNHVADGKRNVKRLTKYVIFCKKRKAVLQETVPVEILAIILAPNYRGKRQHGLQTSGETRCNRTDEIALHFVRASEEPGATSTNV